MVCYSLNFFLGEKRNIAQKNQKSRNENNRSGDSLLLGVQQWIDQALDYGSILHNANMMLISLVCLMGLAWEVSKVYWSHGMYHLVCDPSHQFNKGKIVFWMYMYYASKYIELLDTLFIVLRRSELRFIHSYHHVTTMFITFFGLVTTGTGQWVIILLNVWVHVIMYYYYLLISVGVRDIWWKMYLTDVQLVQFVVDMCGFSYYIFADLVYERPRNNKCTGTLTGAIMGDVIVASFFLLFYRLKQLNLKRMSLLKQKKQSAIVVDAKHPQANDPLKNKSQNHVDHRGMVEEHHSRLRRTGTRRLSTN